MNRLPISILSVVILCLSFASCGSHLSITKRQHSAGYYVDYGKNNPSTDIIDRKAPQEELSDEWLNASADEKLQLQPKATLFPKTPTNEHAIMEGEAIQSTKTIARPNKRKLFKEIAAIQKAKKALSKVTSVKSTLSTPDDGLSLLWLVILIVILLWLLGYLFGGFGLGPIIHLLLLIALILLILWLLRII